MNAPRRRPQSRQLELSPGNCLFMNTLVWGRPFRAAPLRPFGRRKLGWQKDFANGISYIRDEKVKKLALLIAVLGMLVMTVPAFAGGIAIPPLGPAVRQSLRRRH